MTWRGLGGALEAVADLVLPRQCAGCGGAGTRWCACCALTLTVPPPPRTLADGTPVWSAACYDGPVREAVNAWKDHDRADVTEVLALAVASAYVRGGVEAAVLVPVPSSAAARRRRGRAPVDDLTRRAARHLRRVGYADLAARPVLRLRRRVADQAGLAAAARKLNVDGAMHVPPAVARRAHGAAVVLVDDVVTSGATLLEAARALRAAGAGVGGAVTVAATQRHRRDAFG
ncbi:MAG: phosphoribosyltransferase family protein [Angustibacter sp.]